MLIRSVIRRTIGRASPFSSTNQMHNTIHQRLPKSKHASGFISGVKYFATYEGDGKTVGFVLNKKNGKVLMLDSVGVDGFLLSDGREFVGSIIIFPNSLLAWNVGCSHDVNEESLTLFKVLEPKIDILVFGYGSPQQYPPEIRQRFTGLCKKLGIRFEALPTHQAAGLFNFLADDRRFVAGALIPPAFVDKLRFDRRKHLYLEEEIQNDEIEEGEKVEQIESGNSDKKFLK